MKLNLHTHTRWSDGFLSFLELVNYAKREGLEYLAVTDHDRTNAWSSHTMEENRPYINGGIETVSPGILRTEGLQILQGVELSTNDSGKEVHIVGLFLNEPDQEFQIYLESILKFRWYRAGRIAERLGIDTDLLMKEVGDGLPSRLHLGYLIFLREKGRDPSLTCPRDAMEKYVGPKTESYVAFEVDFVYTPQRAIQRIIKSGGIPIWAHPERAEHLPLDDTFKRYRDYAEGRPFGIEVTDLKRLSEMMNRFGLVTVGNDFHGYPYEPKEKPLAIEVPDELIQRLNEAHKAMTK